MSVVPDENLSVDFTNKVGGFMGIGTTQCNAQINFSQNHFYPGAKVGVTLDVDNSKCASAVDFIQLSLIQKVAQRPHNQYTAYYMETEICSSKVKAQIAAKEVGYKEI